MPAASPPFHHYQPPSHRGLDILYQDTDLLAVNKPPGLLSVPGRGPDRQDCQSGRAQAEFPAARIVHRLDMETSGLLLFALHAEAQRRLGLQFERREVHKEYIAVVRGRLPHVAGSIDLPLCSDWPNRPRQKVDFLHGKAALTHYRCLEQPADGTTRLLLNPVTGRSHQLRVHLMHLGHPILGDRLYGEVGCTERLLLHARTLVFTHPGTGRTLHLDCPPDF
ncbi:MAG: pseudouridine synthase [Gammaproteobacteria bacterium]|nr:pseudouridine synthase [Gammaproteobacteria bacterium]